MRPRDHSRLLHLPRRGGTALGHHRFVALPSLLRAGDLLVVNRTEVIRARVHLTRENGRPVELLLCRPRGEIGAARAFWAMGRPAAALKPGRVLCAPDGTGVTVGERRGELIEVIAERPWLALLAEHGEVPLPPYIERSAARASDAGDYQTIFAAEPGAVAAPTASLHFTPRVLEALGGAGIDRAELVLHVGPGTFVPVREVHADDVRGHTMHAECYAIPEATIAAIERTRAGGGRVIAVGTTVVRALESWAATGERAGDATLFIVPGFAFRVVDGMVTNFHLPRSTLLMLVSAFAGRERVLAAYAEAITAGYRFFSYGDAMLIL